MIGQIVILMGESNDFGIPYYNIGKPQSTPFGLAMSILPNLKAKLAVLGQKSSS